MSKESATLPVCYEASGCGYGVYRQILDAGHLCDVIAPALFREKQVSEFLSKFGDAQPPGPRHRRTGTLCAAVITLRTEAGCRTLCCSSLYLILQTASFWRWPIYCRWWSGSDHFFPRNRDGVKECLQRRLAEAPAALMRSLLVVAFDP